MTTPDLPPLPCPFCGSTLVCTREGDGFRWRVALCADCGARSGEVRVQTMGDGNPYEWKRKADVDAIAEWNKRHGAEVDRLRARVAELEAERIGVFSELQADRLKLGAFRNRLVSEVAQASSGPYEYCRAVAESAVNEFETAFDNTMQERGSAQKEQGND